MTSYWKWLAGAVLVVLAALAFRSWLEQHDARLKAESAQTVLQKQVSDAQKSIDAAKQDQAKAADDLKAQLAVIAKQRTVVITPQQAVAKIPEIVPNLPAPVTVQPDPVKPDEQQIVIPQADLPVFQSAYLDCKENDAKLTACNLTAASLQTQLDGTASQLKAQAQETANWKTAAKGTFWQRFLHSAKCVALVGGGAAIGNQVNKNGAIIGATAGVVGCEIWR